MRELLRRYPILTILIPLIGLIVCAERWQLPYSSWSETEVVYPDSLQVLYVVVQDYPHRSPHSFRYEVEVLPARSHVYLYLQQDSLRPLPEPGDTLQVSARLKRGGKLGEFDYGRYLRLNGIVGTAYVPRQRWRLYHQAEAVPWQLRPVVWQHRLYEHYQDCGITGSELATMSALTLGYKEDLDANLRQQFQRAGASHVLAVSGLHTGILYTVLLFLLTGFGLFPPLYDSRNHQRILSFCIVLLLAVYAALTGFTPSVVRSVLMVALVEWCRVWHRQPVSMNLLLVAACMILLFRPQDLYSVSFQLSFAAVAGILLLEPSLVLLFPRHTKDKPYIRPLVSYAVPLLTVSLAAWLYTLPICLYYFGQTSNLFFLTNLIVILMASVLMIGAVGLWTVGWIPPIGKLIAYPVKWAAWLMNQSTGYIEHLPYAVSEAQLPLWAVLAMYTLIIGFTYLLHKVLQ